MPEARAVGARGCVIYLSSFRIRIVQGGVAHKGGSACHMGAFCHKGGRRVTGLLVTRGVLHVTGASCHEWHSACHMGARHTGGSACHRGFMSPGAG